MPLLPTPQGDGVYMAVVAEGRPILLASIQYDQIHLGHQSFGIISSSTANAFLKHKIRTVQDIIGPALTREEMLQLRGIGKACILQIEKLFAFLNLTIGQNPAVAIGQKFLKKDISFPESLPKQAR